MKHKILVTGGAGFIGTHTVIELVNAGHEVVIVDNLVNSSKKSVEVVVDDFYNLCPEGRLHVGRVDRWVELIGRDVVVEALQLGDMLQQLVEVEVLKRTGLGIFYHSDSSASVNQ